ncbi:uncharacterized protein LOC129583051 [Paramacrobiotus metropolitanus]|uniref:uncharacterized protein LOC129583051 n=1 Tax=Paramacrobiotus metropolitanus TaxID=2943436 RepID=UPI0024457A89|nr:uncharacterized protein LOC129583051 [Paramacrobiotus metropolitanus]
MARREWESGRSDIQRLLHKQTSAPYEPPEISDDMMPLSLPAELLIEVFRSLDSVGRIRCRRVCPLWDGILTTEANFPDVQVSFGHPDYGVLNFAHHGMYWMAVCLRKCLSSRTKVAIIMDIGGERCEQVSALLDMILTPARLPILLFDNCDWSAAYAAVGGVVDSVAQTFRKSGCNKVVWKRCEMADRLLKARVARHTFSAASSGELESELWDLFEKNLVLTKPVDRTTLSTSVADCLAGRSTALTAGQIVEALNKYQRVDPRPSTPYRHREWTEASIGDLDPSRLTTLTAAVLSKSIDSAASSADGQTTARGPGDAAPR